MRVNDRMFIFKELSLSEQYRRDMCFGTWRVLTDLLATGSLFQSLADITQPPEKSAIIWDVPLVADTLLHWSDVNLFPDQSLLLFRYLECDENHYHGWITQRYRLAHCKSAILMYHNGPSELVKVGSLVWDASKYRKRTRCRHPIWHIFFFLNRTWRTVTQIYFLPLIPFSSLLQLISSFSAFQECHLGSRVLNNPSRSSVRIQP